MPTSLPAILAPEAQHLLGCAALVLTLIGAIVWFAGIKIARALVSAFTGSVVAAIAAWLLPKTLGIAPLTAAFAGFAVGAFLGALAFRILQGITLALCLGVAVSGGYYRWHVQQITPPSASAPAAQSLPVPNLLIQAPLAEQAATQALHAGTELLTTVTQNLQDRWNALNQTDQRRMLAAGLGTAAIVLLLAFGFARHTTWFVSALVGTAMLFNGLEAAAHAFTPNLQSLIPTAILPRYALMALIAALGLLLQRILFWPKKRQPAPTPPPAAPGMGPA